MSKLLKRDSVESSAQQVHPMKHAEGACWACRRAMLDMQKGHVGHADAAKGKVE